MKKVSEIIKELLLCFTFTDEEWLELYYDLVEIPLSGASDKFRSKLKGELKELIKKAEEIT